MTSSWPKDRTMTGSSRLSYTSQPWGQKKSTSAKQYPYCRAREFITTGKTRASSDSTSAKPWTSTCTSGTSGRSTARTHGGTGRCRRSLCITNISSAVPEDSRRSYAWTQSVSHRKQWQCWLQSTLVDSQIGLCRLKRHPTTMPMARKSPLLVSRATWRSHNISGGGVDTRTSNVFKVSSPRDGSKRPFNHSN